MTTEEVIALTYPFPPQPGEGVTHLRMLMDYGNPPSQRLFGGPWDADRLQDERRRRYSWPNRIQEIVKRGYLDWAEVEVLEREFIRYQDAIEQAIHMAEAGWTIYIRGFYVAVLVRPDGCEPWWEREEYKHHNTPKEGRGGSK